MPYSPEYFLARESWRDWRIEARELIRLARIERGARVLEIGCGGGGLLRMLRDCGANVVGVDTLDAALKLAEVSLRAPKGRSNLSARESESDSSQTPQRLPAMTNFPLLPHSTASLPSLIQIGTDNHLPFAPSTFDAILGQHVIEHIADADAALREWHRLLKPNGRLALATPNARYPDPAHFADADHAYIFSPNELGQAITRAGFLVESCFTVFTFLTQVRVLRGLGIVGYNLFRRLPFFSTRGRTILIAARKN